MSELTPGSNEPRTGARTGAKRDVSERFAELGRGSDEARRRKREAKEELSVDDKAERELDRLLSSADPKEREKGLRQYGYVRGKRQPTPAKQEPDVNSDDGPRGMFLSGVLELARETGVEFVTLDDVVAYARRHDLVLRPRRDGEEGAPLLGHQAGATPPPRKLATPTSLWAPAQQAKAKAHRPNAALSAT
jgi:hypothetical protein